MLLFTLVTNVNRDKINDEVLKGASELIADLFDGTEQVSQVYFYYLYLSIKNKFLS